MFGTSIPSDSNDSNDNEPVTMVDKLTATTALTTIAHALTDYVLSSPDVFDQFYRLLQTGTSSDASSEDVRESIESAHDAFAAMSAQASSQLMMAKLFESMGMGNVQVMRMGGDDNGDDLPDIDLGGYPYI